MNRNRLNLHEDLCKILGNRTNVYFQPPASVTMRYPAIVYSRSNIDNTHANNDVYNQSITYKVTVLDHDPDSVITEKLSKFRYATFDRHFATNGLNHDQFTINYNNNKEN